MAKKPIPPEEREELLEARRIYERLEEQREEALRATEQAREQQREPRTCGVESGGDAGGEVEGRMQSASPSDEARTPEERETAARRARRASEDSVNFQRGTGEQSLTEEERAEGRFESEGEPTQIEEDFGERGLRMRGGIHDAAHEPSILEEPEEDEQ